MATYHDLLSSGALSVTQAFQPGLITAGAHGGTGAPIYAGNHLYHLVLLTGSLGAAGTVRVYGHTDATGSGTAILGSVVFAAGTLAVAYEAKQDALLTLGSTYTHLSAQVIVPAGGTMYASLLMVSHTPRA
ncbi:MAG: hypothetical protein N3D77_16275, partial [Geminicoccaceae bacterium]|nr:hypothetical protein [Geminicoccaceae bacterium]